MQIPSNLKLVAVDILLGVAPGKKSAAQRISFRFSFYCVPFLIIYKLPAHTKEQLATVVRF